MYSLLTDHFCDIVIRVTNPAGFGRVKCGWNGILSMSALSHAALIYHPIKALLCVVDRGFVELTDHSWHIGKLSFKRNCFLDHLLHLSFQNIIQSYLNIYNQHQLVSKWVLIFSQGDVVNVWSCDPTVMERQLLYTQSNLLSGVYGVSHTHFHSLEQACLTSGRVCGCVWLYQHEKEVVSAVV